MKTMKKIYIMLILIFTMFVFVTPSFGALSTQVTSDVELINVDKNAPGTKLTGPLTIYFANYDSSAGTADMYVFLRLRKGYELYSFSTSMPGITYSASNIEVLTGYINDFIADSVLPEIYAGATPPFAIKSVDQIVQDDPICSYCSGLNFAIMDVVIAVMD